MRSRVLSCVALMGVALSGCGSDPVTGSSGTTQSTSTTAERSSPSIVPLDGDSPARPVCPASIGTSPTFVPAKPTIGDTTDALVPNQVPAYAVVCSYPAGTNMSPTPTTSSFSLASSVQVVSGLSAVPDDLGHLMADTKVARPCTAMGGAQTQRLLGLQYARGVVWVSSLDEVNSCSVSTNGAFTTSAFLGRALADAARTGSWKMPDRTTPCGGGPSGRAGADRWLVPGTPSGLVICVDAKPRPASDDLTRKLREALNRLSTAPSQHGASCTGDGGKHAYLMFDYAVGPSVWVTVSPKCTPQVMGDGLQADPAEDVVQLLEGAGYL